MTWTIPNILSIVRVVAAPCLALAYAIYDRPEADRIAFGVFVVAAITDYVDGILARSMKQESAFGKMLDPVADKAMVMIALAIIVALQDLQWQYLMPTALIMAREVLVSGLREFLGDVKLHVTKLAKWKTTLQMFAIGFTLGADAVNPKLGDPFTHPAVKALLPYATIAAGSIGLALLWFAAWLTLVTGFDYFVKGMPHIRGKEQALKAALKAEAPAAAAAETDS